MGLIKFISSQLFLHPQRNGSKVMNPENFKDPYIATESFVENYRIITVCKKDSSNIHIYFMHGGAYTLEPVVFHMNIIRKLADCGFVVSFIDYPLAPENKAEKTIKITKEGFKFIADKYPEHKLVLMGDSSGGGLALSLLMQFRDENYEKRPVKTLMLSPWLDLTMTFEDQKKYEKSDKVLDRKVLRKIGSIYADTIETNNWLVSPIYGNIDNLGQFLVFYSDQEVLRTDSDRFIELSKTAAGTNVDFYMEHKAAHDFLMIPDKNKVDLYYSMIKDFFM